MTIRVKIESYPNTNCDEPWFASAPPPSMIPAPCRTPADVVAWLNKEAGRRRLGCIYTLATEDEYWAYRRHEA
jgi:hypothetical protein